MKKILPVIVIVLAIGLAFFFFRGTKETDSGSDVALDGPVGASDEAVYSVRLDITERKPRGEVPVLTLGGSLSQRVQAPNDYVSEWKSIDELTMMGQSIANQRDAMIGKGILSSYDAKEKDYLHYLPQDFPSQMTSVQLGLLRKIVLPLAKGELKEASFTRTESDEIGGVKVSYSIRPSAEGFEVERVWLQYVTQGVKVDKENNTLRYTVNKDGRLVSAEGRITLHYRQTEAMHYTTALNVKLKGRQAVSASPKVVKKEELKKTDYRELAQQSADASNPDKLPWDEAMKRLDQINEKSDSTEVYRVFQNLKAEVIREPAKAQELFDKINKTPERDPSSKRKLTVVFGALAQSESTEIAEQLANQAKQCPDSFCKIQSIVGVSDHPYPNETTAAVMLDIAANASDQEIAGTALLAAGAIGRKLDSDLPQLPQTLIGELNNPAKAEIKGTVLAAMGNHGNAEYLTSLETYAKSSKDVGLQASAVYSMRYLPQESVNDTLLNVLSQSKDKVVIGEAFKAIEYRNLSADQYQSLAKGSAEIKDRDLAQAAARVLVQAYKDDPKLEGPVSTLRDQTQVKEVKDYLEAEIKHMQELQNDPNAGAQ